MRTNSVFVFVVVVPGANPVSCGLWSLRTVSSRLLVSKAHRLVEVYSLPDRTLRLQVEIPSARLV
jgi:hypothetical protein